LAEGVLESGLALGGWALLLPQHSISCTAL